MLGVENLELTFDDFDNVTLGAAGGDNCDEVTLEDATLELVCREAASDVVAFAAPAADGVTFEVNSRVVTFDEVTTGIRR